MDVFTRILPIQEYDPDDRAVQQLLGRHFCGPVCQRCNQEASRENGGVLVTLRRSWDPLDKNERAALDAICKRCQEKYRG